MKAESTSNPNPYSSIPHSSSSSNQREITNYHYFQKYELLYQLGSDLHNALQEISNKHNLLQQHITQLAIKADSFTDSIRPGPREKKKKERRVSDEIHKSYTCHADHCERQYGTESSLRNHMKMKHPEAFQPRKRGRRSGSKDDDF